MSKRCRVCGEPRHEKDTGRFMCDPCFVGLDVDIARVKSIPRRLARGVRRFIEEATRVD